MTKNKGYSYSQKNSEMAHACNCIGPQGGKPLCPCRMRNVTIENGRYVEKRDYGPVKDDFERFFDSYGS